MTEILKPENLKSAEEESGEPSEIELTPEQEAAKQEMIEQLSKGWINDAIKIKKKFSLPEEVITSSEVQEAAKQRMIEQLSRGYIDNAIEIKDQFSLPEEVITFSEVQEIAKQEIIKQLSKGDIYNAIQIKNQFSLSEEVITSSEVQEAAKQVMIKQLSLGWIDNVIKIKDRFFLSEAIITFPEVQEAAKQGMINMLSGGYINAAIEIKDQFSLPEEVITSSEVQEVAKQRMIKLLSLGGRCINDAIRIRDQFSLFQEVVQEIAKQEIIKQLSKGEIYNAIQIRDQFSLPEAIITSSEVQEAAKQEMIKRLSGGEYINAAIKIKEKFSLSEEVITSSEVQEAAKQGMINMLSGGNIDDAIKVKEEFSLPEAIIISSEVQEAAKQGMIKRLSKGEIYNAIQIRDQFFLSEEIITSSEVQEAAKQGMIKALSGDWIDTAIEIKEEFSLPEEIVQEAAKQRMIELLPKEYISTAIEIKEKFSLPEEIVQEVAKQRMIELLSGRYINAAIKIKEKFSLPEAIITSSEVQEAAKQGMINMLSGGDIDTAIKVKEQFSLPEEVITSLEVQEAAKQGMIKALSEGNIYNAIEIKNRFSLSEAIITSSEVQEAAKQGMIKQLLDGSIDTVIEIKDQFSLSEEVITSSEVQEAAKQEMIKRLSKGEINYAIKIKEEFSLPEEVVQEAAKQGMIKQLSGGNIDIAIKIKDRFSLPEEVVQEAAKQGMIKALSEGDIDTAIKIKKEFSLPEEEIFILWQEDDSLIKSAVEKNNFGFQEMLEFYRINLGYFNWLKSSNKEWIFIKEDLEDNISTLNLTLTEAQILKEQGEDLAELTKNDNEENRQKIFETLTGAKELEDWQDQQNIVQPFEAGAKIFGYQKIFSYIDREKLSRHDALFSFNKIIKLFNSSSLKASKFYGQILEQVKRDDSSYTAGTAHHQLNTIATNIDLDFEKIIDKAREYKEINKLQDLVETLRQPEDIFASWKNLKKYSDLCELVGRTEILDQLKELKKQGKNELYQYIETLAFHPNIDMKAVFKFWREPESFLEEAASHVGQELHDSKKPSNYIHIPNLDLTAAELRDALVEGQLDKIQAFAPLEIIYSFPKEQTAEVRTTKDLIMHSVGTRKKELQSVYGSPNPKFFKFLQTFCKEKKIPLTPFLQDKEKLTPKQEEKIREFLQAENPKLFPPDTVKYRAKINLKSDPSAVVAGNDTSCCMPFGDGKNNVYTFNPVCSLFTLQQQKPDGSWRTIAQSVLTKDKDIKRNIAEIVEQLQSTDKPDITKILPEDILIEARATLACDNVEVAPNIRGHKPTEKQMELIYRDFFAEYFKRRAKIDNLDPSQVVIGKGYSDSLSHLPQIPNTYAPLAPVSYSDKTHETVYQLIPEIAKGINKRIVELKKPVNTTQETELNPNIKGLAYLTFEDTLPVAFIEGKAYDDNETLIQYLHNMENALIAKDINNVAKDRPNMSLKHQDKKGKVNGYLLAYEGKLKEQENQSVIYISDIAVEEKKKGVGISLMLGFADLYKKNYLDKGNLIPIYAEAREQTSFAMIKKKWDDLGQAIGWEFKLEEQGTYQHGGDTIHRIMIRPVKAV